MSVFTESTAPPDERFAVPPVWVWRLTVDQYHEMIRAGILTENEPVELLDGWLVPKMPKNPPHRVATGLVREALEKTISKGWYVDSQEPITLTESEPEPDIVLVRGRRRDYEDRHPGPDDIGLVVEVADATLEFDRTFKKSVYARAGIGVYWIVNLVDRRVEVYTGPTGRAESPDYRQRHDYAEGGTVPVFLDGQERARIDVDNMLPRRTEVD